MGHSRLEQLAFTGYICTNIYVVSHSVPPRGQWLRKTYEPYLILYIMDPSRGKEIVLKRLFKEAYTGFSPFFQMFGHSPWLSVDLLFDLGSDPQQGKYQNYVKTWQVDMRQAYDVASSAMQQLSARSKEYYDRKASSAVLLPGNHVLVKNLSERGAPGKLLSH